MQEAIPVIVEAILAELSTAADHGEQQKERREDMLAGLQELTNVNGYG